MPAIETYKVRIEGTRPLLMHRISDLGNGNSKRGKQHDPEKEAAAAVYRDAEGNIVVPMLNVLSALRDAAVDFRVAGKGKKTHKNYIYAGIRIEPEEIPLEYEPNGDKPWAVDIRPVVLNKKDRIPRARPRFDKWALEFVIQIVDPIINPDSLKAILEAAGRYVGLCDFRPLFGLFQVTKFEPVAEAEE